jgi:hypothetical protein
VTALLGGFIWNSRWDSVCCAVAAFYWRARLFVRKKGEREFAQIIQQIFGKNPTFWENNDW